MKGTKGILVLLVLAVLLGACKKSGVSTTQSEKTGWKYNDSKRGFYNVKTEYDGKIPPGMVYISTMTSVKGQNENPVSSPMNDLKRRIGINGYFMDEFEVTNINWREYEQWLRGVYRHDPRQILLAMPDETVWRQELAYNEPLVKNYYTHVGFGFYPVVGVTWEQAMAYCAWRTDRVNERILIERKIIDFNDLETINANIENADESEYSSYIFFTTHKNDYLRAYYGEEEPVMDLDGIIYDSEFRLPTEAEWEYAAYGITPVEGNIEEGHTYPWGGSQLRTMNGKKKTQGRFNANFVRGRGDLIGQEMNNTPTVPVDFFSPNEYGLYNMAGNVNEWVLDVYRSTSNELVNEINPFRGNVYDSDSAYAEQILRRLPPMDDDQRDSMRNVLIMEKKFKVSGSDVRSFKDGDLVSSLADSILNYKDATPIEQANMISDEARIYKGGSWRDRAIWLNPATRRWLYQNDRASDVGFRCAMSAVGSNKTSTNR